MEFDRPRQEAGHLPKRDGAERGDFLPGRHHQIADVGARGEIAHAEPNQFLLQFRIGAGAVIGPNVVLSASVPIIDVTGPEPVEHRGVVPPRKVVLPGVRQKEFPAGTFGLQCALIVGERSASTDLKTSLNDVLREFEIAV